MDAVGSATGIGTRHANVAGGNSFRGHVTLAANIGLGKASNEVAADAKIANFDLPSRVHENVGRLHVAVDDVVVIFERFEAHCGGEGDLSEYVLGNAVPIEFVYGTSIHKLQTNIHGSFLEKGAVKIHDEGG